MFSRLASAWANCRRMVRSFPKARDLPALNGSAASVPSDATWRTTSTANGHDLSRSGRTLPGGSASSAVCPVIRAQSELASTMLKAMIIASGGSVLEPAPSESRPDSSETERPRQNGASLPQQGSQRA
jgi:hypothetical protein